MKTLSSEQQNELSRLNEVFKPFEALANVNDEQGELAIHGMMTEQFEMHSPDRESLDELGKRRSELLQKQSAAKGTLVKK
jgi:hypothetical protein